MKTALPISCTIITLNAARHLDRVLDSISWSNDIVLVDSGSTDETLAIAKRHGCRIFHRDFDGYGAQKRFACEQAQHNWIFNLDADEVISAELGEEIQSVIASAPEPHTCFTIPSHLIFMNRDLETHHVIRLYNRNFSRFSTARVHECVIPHGPICHLQNGMNHYSYHNLHDYFSKLNRYTSAAATTLATRSTLPRHARMLFALPLTFFKTYILHRHCLHGWPGLAWSLLSALSPFIKYAKLYEKKLSP